MPQGSVLSVTLFIVKMNTITSVIPPNLSYSLYVDDIQISISSSNLALIERQLQIAINKLSKWADENGFRFSLEKTTCVMFSRRRGLSLDPSLSLNGHDIAVQSAHKFLGVIFDRRLTFLDHLRSVKQKCQKALNILKVLSHKSWGSDTETMLCIYKSVVRSILDYGCVVYGSAKPSSLRLLDPIHNTGLRLSTGAFRTSPIESLNVEANEWTLERRRVYLSFMYALQVKSRPGHPTRPCVEATASERLYAHKPSIPPPLGIRLHRLVSKYQFQPYTHSVLEMPEGLTTWQPLSKVCDLTLTKYRKTHISAVVIRQEFEELKSRYGNHDAYYTDGTKSTQGVGFAMVTNRVQQCGRLIEQASIYTAELYAIKTALEHILLTRVKRAIIYSDSLSALSAVSSHIRTKNALVAHVRRLMLYTQEKALWVKLVWVPSHVGIDGNELADKAAAESLNQGSQVEQIPYQDLRPHLKKLIYQQWQTEWKQMTSNKLHLVQPHLRRYPRYRHECRRSEVVYCRLRIGHTFLTHNFLLKQADPPGCACCGEPLTVLHVLLACRAYEQERYRYFAYFYNNKIPLHPILLLGEKPLVEFQLVLQFLNSINVLKYI